MKKLFALLVSTAMLLSLAACANSGQGNGAESNDSETTQAVETTQAATDAPTLDAASLNWVKGELNCFDYSYKNQPYYLSYEYPDSFQTSSTSESGLQSFSFYFNPADSEATANTSPYGLYINFGQGSFGGATKESLEEDMDGGLTERELGGRTVLFGELSTDPNTGSHVFAYYLSYDEDEWSRIWILLCDPEEDGSFRQAFEQSMSFDKE